MLYVYIEREIAVLQRCVCVCDIHGVCLEIIIWTGWGISDNVCMYLLALRASHFGIDMNKVLLSGKPLCMWQSSALRIGVNIFGF